ncbi:Phospholipase A1-IIdelta [Bienertia sinuspersici]
MDDQDPRTLSLRGSHMGPPSRLQQLGGSPGPTQRRTPSCHHPMRGLMPSHLRHLHQRSQLRLLRLQPLCQIQPSYKTCFPGGSHKYDVVGFLYATARVSVPEAFLFKSMSRERWDRESNWIGYIAVSNDEVSRDIGRREVYVAFRGTTRNYEWINVLGAKLKSAMPLMSLDGLHADEDLSITFTGHSLGATLSILSAFDIANNLTSEIPISAIIFGSPKVGNKRFKKKVDSHPNLKILHVRNVIDTIPHYPARLMGYVHIGIELEIDSRKSPYLKESRHVGDWHNLQAMLHIVNGWQGIKDEFRLVIRRSIALVNKSCDFLKEECLVPPSWWVEKNKGMVLNEQGEWVWLVLRKFLFLNLINLCD